MLFFFSRFRFWEERGVGSPRWEWGWEGGRGGEGRVGGGEGRGGGVGGRIACCCVNDGAKRDDTNKEGGHGHDAT
jgi:hypothetical protein